MCQKKKKFIPDLFKSQYQRYYTVPKGTIDHRTDFFSCKYTLLTHRKDLF